MPSTVLILESDPASRDLAALALRRLGCKVILGESGGEAIQLIRAHRPQLVLLNIVLSETGGLNVMRQIQALPPKERPPVIVVSALGFREVVEQAVAAGAKDFLVKPLDTQLLVTKVRRLLGIEEGPPNA
jgi:CheY-like chemotaxis protein